MFKNFFKSAAYIASLAIISIVGSFAINSAIAAWTSPAQDPPNGNVSNPTVWLDGGTNVYLSTLTDYVGIGTQNPNKQLHLKTASGNAELDIQSASQNYWAIYHDDTTEQLRFWNADFAGDIGAGAGNAFVIDNDGTILVKTPVDGDSDNAIATKGYVDAAGGGGDATLANQELIKGEGFATSTDSLNGISGKLTEIGNSLGDATYDKQIEIMTKVDHGNGWILQNQTYFSVGGNTNFCRSNVVNGSGQVTVSNINNNSQCEYINGYTWRCTNGECVKSLTWTGSAKTEQDCFNGGGTVFDTGSGTICKFSGTDVICPSGWTQASNWQKYSSIGWGTYTSGDSCGFHSDEGPLIFANTQSVNYERGSYTGSIGVTPTCSGFSEYWKVEITSDRYYLYNYSSSAVTTNRIQIGCK